MILSLTTPQKDTDQAPTQRNCGLVYVPCLCTGARQIEAFIILKPKRNRAIKPPKPGTPAACFNLLTREIDIDIAIFKYSKASGHYSARGKIGAYTWYQFKFDAVTHTQIAEIRALL